MGKGEQHTTLRTSYRRTAYYSETLLQSFPLQIVQIQRPTWRTCFKHTRKHAGQSKGK